MTTIGHEAADFDDARHRPFTRAALVLFFWIAAAILVASCHMWFDVLSPAGGAVAAMASIGLSAWVYTRLCAPHAGAPHALGVGIAWLVLAIAAEIAFSSRTGHGWYSLIGSPAHPLLRNVFLFAWVFAPALFAHREVEPSPSARQRR